MVRIVPAFPQMEYAKHGLIVVPGSRQFPGTFFDKMEGSVVRITYRMPTRLGLKVLINRLASPA